MSVEDVLDEAVRYLDKPFWKATEYIWDQSLIYKVIGLFGMIVAVPCAVASRSLHWGMQRYSQRSYISYESKAAPGTGAPKKFLTFNVCMFPGILPTLFGGVRTAAQRMDELAGFLKTQDADIVCLQEMAFDPSVQLIDKLKDHYRYFYYRIGPHPFGMDSALFWASKFPLVSEPKFIEFNVPNMQRGIRRGFFVAELADRYVITTHLDPHSGKEAGDVRAAQIKAIVTHFYGNTKPVMLLGDLNIEAEDDEALQLLQTNFLNFNRAAVENPDQTNTTCIDNMSKVVTDLEMPAKYTYVDHILMTDQKIQQAIVHILKPEKFSASLSDHHAVVLSL